MRFILFSLFLLITIIFIAIFAKNGNQENNMVGVAVSNTPAIPTVFPTPDQTVKLLLVGDIMVGRSVNMRSLDMGNVNYPFEKVAERLKNADITFGNLESPIVYDCPVIEHGFTFCGDPKMADGLTYAGIDILTIANNHNMNFGKRGYEDTKKILTDKRISWVGDGNLEIIEKKGIKFGFLGFDFVTDTNPGKAPFDLIRESDKKVDVLVVGVHWGNEYKAIANSHQNNWAKEIIKAGADIISGHHPHWVQNSELIEGKPVFYSLGNFVFDQMWSEETKKGLAVELTFDGTRIIKEEKLLTYMNNWAQPEWVIRN